MQLIGLRRILPKTLRRALRNDWNELLTWEHNYRERRFYRQIIQPNDLVFDVGANVGRKTDAFLALGARVVAIEPNPNCIQQLRDGFARAVRDGSLIIEPVAATRDARSVTLTVFNRESAITSGSTEFVEYARTIGEVASRELTVKSVTLDELVARHGIPTFIKVDAEGMDAEVLIGLTIPPRILSFEYHTAPKLWNDTFRCFNEVKRLGFTEANLTSMAEPAFIYKTWIGIDQVLSRIKDWAKYGQHWGDVICR